MSEIAVNTETAPRESVGAVYRRIRRMILSGEFQSGQALSQVQLALDFDTSRGPVREALRMLQREGLVDAATNQQGRVATFSLTDMEQVCALLVVNVGAAIVVGDGLFTNQDIERVQSRIDLIERLADREETESPACTARRILRRRMAFRRLVTLLCRYAGPQVVALINGLLDRIALFRQMHELMGDAPPYPLADRFTELREASERRDACAMAAIITDKIADVSRKALAYVSERHRPALLEAYVALAQTMSGHGVPAGGEAGRALTIKVRVGAGGKLSYVVDPEAR